MACSSFFVLRSSFFVACSIALLTVLSACDFGNRDTGPAFVDELNDESTIDELPPPSRARAYYILNHMLNDSLSLDFVDESYHADGEFSHLRVRLRTPGRLSRKLAIMANGSIIPIHRARRLFNDEHRKNWGVVHLPFARSLADPNAERINLPVVIFFDGESSTQSALELISGEANSIENSSVLDFAVAHFQIERTEILDAAFVDGVYGIFDGRAEAEPYIYDPVNNGVANYTRSFSSFNKAGYFGGIQNGGDRVHIGLSDYYLPPECGIWDAHEAFQYAEVIHHSSSPVACNTYTDCISVCEELGRCIGGICLEGHATMVASRISASTGSAPPGERRRHASDVRIFVGNNDAASNLSHPNDWFDDPNTNTFTGNAHAALVERYDYFHNNDVHLVNESWGFDFPNMTPQVSYKDVLNDIYSRYGFMTFVQAAGNRGHESSNTVACHALNSVCVGSTHAWLTYHDSPEQYLDDRMDPTSSWVNPSSASDPNVPQDAERPDVVSEGYSATVVDIGDPPPPWGHYPTTTDWMTARGTSFAAPAITGLLALLQECRGGPLTSAANRAILRTAASVPQNLEDNPNAPVYPIPGLSPDSRAGAGIVDAHDLMRFCPGSDPDVGFDEGEVDLTGPGWEEVPEWMLTDEPDDSVICTQNHEGCLAHVQQELVRAPGADVRRIELRNFGNLTEGSRIRVTFSYYTCPPLPANMLDFVDDLAPANDLDIALCPSDAGIDRCIIYSESLDDTNEGFDVILDDDYEGVKVYLLRDWDNREICNGSPIEPMTLAWKLWRN